MSPKRASFDVVRTIARDLPGVQESTMYGLPALKMRGKFLACMASHKSAEPGSLVVRTSFENRDALIADDPRTYYVKPHYQDYPSVLVRLSVIDREALRAFAQRMARGDRIADDAWSAHKGWPQARSVPRAVGRESRR
jgi:hypothetical protein